jgi:hypothetical protein
MDKEVQFYECLPEAPFQRNDPLFFSISCHSVLHINSVEKEQTQQYFLANVHFIVHDKSVMQQLA